MAVIDIKGIIVSQNTIDAAGAGMISKLLEAAGKDRSVAAVVLDMETPGGGVTASDELHHAVQKLREAGKPVVTCMGSVGASGGYLVAAGTDYIIANRLTLTGSIGVIASTLNYAGLFDKVGLHTEIYKSGKMKDALHGGRERTPEEKALIQDIVASNFYEFAVLVAEGRSRFETTDDVLAAEFADGRVMTGAQALDYGLVDELGYFDDAVSKARELGQAPNARVVRFRPPLRLRDLFFASPLTRMFGLEKLVPASLRHLQTGQFYYLLPGAVQ